MGKILILGVIACIIFYFITRKISSFKYNNLNASVNNKPIIEITVPTFILQDLLKRTLITVGTGFLILIIILIVASKFKLALIALPLSFYLIGQYFVFNNHIKSIKKQKLSYDQKTNLLFINNENEPVFSCNLSSDSLLITEVKSVQKNNNIHFGYYEITDGTQKHYISNLLAENPQNIALFKKLSKLNKNTESKLFPII